MEVPAYLAHELTLTLSAVGLASTEHTKAVGNKIWVPGYALAGFQSLQPTAVERGVVGSDPKTTEQKATTFSAQDLR